MKVSIVIPVYEMRGEGVFFLNQNIERIKKQSFKDIELVITDHSKDFEIKKLCESYKEDNIELNYIRNEKNRGNSSYNLNLGMSNCKGDIVKFMMQDEYLYDINSIKKIHDCFLDEKIQWCVTGCYFGDKTGSIKGSIIPFYNKDMAKGNNTIGSPSVVTVKNKDLKFFDENLIWVMDCDYYIRMYNDYGDPHIINEPLVFVTQHSDQITSWLSNEIKEKENIFLEKKYING